MKHKALLFSPLALIPVGTQTAVAGQVHQTMTYPPSWTGFYVGANLGGISAHSALNSYNPTPGGISSYCFRRPACSIGSQSATGVLGGGQIGYNFQSANWVYDVDSASISRARVSRSVLSTAMRSPATGRPKPASATSVRPVFASVTPSIAR